ncbi:NFACT family protein [bacterium]|nr:NFACT family protein [bacterium]
MHIDAVTLKALTLELAELLAGGIIQKISHLNSSDLLLQIRQPGHTYRLLIQLGREQTAMCLTEREMPPAQVPSSLVMQLRKHLQGQRLVSLEQPTLARTVFLSTERHTLAVELSGRRNNILLLNAQRIIMGKMLPEPAQAAIWPVGQRFAPQSGGRQPNVLAASMEEVRHGLIDALGQPALQALTRGLFGLPPWHAKDICRSVGLESEAELTFAQLDILLQGIGLWRQRLLCGPYDPVTLPNGKVSPWSLGLEDEISYPDISQAINAEKRLPGLEEQRAELLHAITKMQKKRSSTLEKMRAQQKDAEQLEELKEYGNLILAYMYQIPPRAASAEVYDSQGRLITVRLDPNLSAADNAQRYFKEYKRLKRAQISVVEPMNRMSQELEFIADMELAAQRAETIQELEELKEIWEQEFAPPDRSAKRSRRINAPALGPRVFSHRGFTILVGRNPLQNDTISTKIASKGDIWLHTLRVPGAHVLIKTAGSQPPPETIAAAAHLAARHSHAKLDSRAEVIYTDAKYVHKVKGSPPGRVIVKTIKTIVASPHTAVEGLTEESKKHENS